MAKKFLKNAVHYRAAERPDFRCGSCIHFQPVDESEGYGYCTLVIGRISAEGVCDLWEPNPLLEPGDTIYELHKKNDERKRQLGEVKRAQS